MPIADQLLPELDQEAAKTRTVLERCPEDKYNWRPHQKSWTMAVLATHIANLLGWGVDTITKDSFDVAPAGAPPYKVEPVTSRAQLLERFDRNVTAFRQALSAATDQQLTAPWSLLQTGKVLFTVPRIAILRGMIMNHSIHHRGQLTVYLRLNDVPVPAVYGPSADEAGM